MSEITDAERYQALKEFLAVARDEPGEWTCWLDLSCVPFRSQTTDPQELVDLIVRIKREQR
jgi:hypothetical protein